MREAAADALAALAARSPGTAAPAAPALRGCLADPDIDVRRAAAGALGNVLRFNELQGRTDFFMNCLRTFKTSDPILSLIHI